MKQTIDNTKFTTLTNDTTAIDAFTHISTMSFKIKFNLLSIIRSDEIQYLR